MLDGSVQDGSVAGRPVAGGGQGRATREGQGDGPGGKRRNDGGGETSPFHDGSPVPVGASDLALAAWKRQDKCLTRCGEWLTRPTVHGCSLAPLKTLSTALRGPCTATPTRVSSPTATACTAARLSSSLPVLNSSSV